MGRRKKKHFIEKKNAVKFQVVHRSQRDPLQASEEHGQHVLVPVTTTTKTTPVSHNTDGDNNNEGEGTTSRHMEELKTYGIYYDDDYDYMQHLKETSSCSVLELVSTRGCNNNTTDTAAADSVTNTQTQVEDTRTEPKLKLPSCVFASTVEEEVGLLNKAAPLVGPQLDWDPDIVAAMDDDFDFNNDKNQLEDDFIVHANAPLGGSTDDQFFSDLDDDHGSTASDGYVPSDEGDMDFHCRDDGDSDNTFGPRSLMGRDLCEDGDEETRSRFTAYSASSSVIKRNQQLSLLDDRFEKIFEEYDEDEIGALDDLELGGCVNANSDLLKQVIEGHHHDTQQAYRKVALASLDHDLMSDSDCQLHPIVTPPISYTLSSDSMKPPSNRAPLDDERGANKAQAGGWSAPPPVGTSSESSSSDEELIKMTADDAKPEWDCESVLTRYSDLYNHPTRITALPRTKLKLSVRKDPTKSSPSAQESGNPVANSKVNPAQAKVITTRAKGESKDERKKRKQVVKEHRRDRRLERKNNEELFKAETHRQQQILVNMNQNMQGISLF